MRQKASVGGTFGPAPLGYRNSVDHLSDSRRIKTVKVDPERGPLITTAFELYATGEYSLWQLTEELERLGLRTLSTPRWPEPRPVKTSTLQRILRSAYYAGWVVYARGKPEEEIFRGRHEPLVDQDTFDQARLDEKRVSGERPHSRQHYLRGSVFCGQCGRRLVYGVSRGNGGQYAYYFCASRINGRSCGQRVNMRPELIEAAIHSTTKSGRYSCGRRRSSVGPTLSRRWRSCRAPLCATFAR